MAIAFNIQGPVSLHVHNSLEAGSGTEPTFHSGTGESYAVADTYKLGVTDNDDLISVDFENIKEPVFSTQGGAEPAAMIYQGTIATITATLIKWDTARKDIVLGSIWNNANGVPGTIGQDILSGDVLDAKNLQIGIFPEDAGIKALSSETYAYEFRKCWCESIQETSWGNAPKKLVVVFKAIRNSSGRLYERV
tara:strand:- start:4392 stop:4970 length:579 start_codon:yes stop_codon:yes gene_type:complete